MKLFRRKSKSAEKTARPAVMIRGFAAAEVDRLLSGWQTDAGFTPSEISSHLESVRGHSREMAKNSEHMKKFLALVSTNVVGEGFRFKSTPRDILQGKPVIDTAAAKFIEYHWWRFCNHRDALTTHTWFDVTGIQTESAMDRLCAKTWARDGEYFIQIIEGAANPYGIAFRVLRPDWCDHTYNVSNTGRGTLIHAGVERRIDTRRPVAYWFHSTPTSAYQYNGRGMPLISIPASQIIHGFDMEDSDQPRGIPWTHAGLRKLKMLDLYNEAEITAARDEACSVRSYEAQDGADVDGLIDLTDPDNAEVANALTMAKQPGQAEIVPRGYKQNIHTPQHPNRELTAFKNSMLRDVASGFGVEYANFANDWAGVSFSSVRAGTITERDNWIVIQNDMINQCKQVQFLAWLRSFLTYSVSGQLPIAKIEKFAEHEFRGRRWMWVDPMKDMKAAEVAVDRGWKTNTQIAGDLGTDFDDNMEQYSVEKKTKTDAGFIEASRPGAAAPVQTQGEA
jgi:lambda family phage portal protein